MILPVSSKIYRVPPEDLQILSNNMPLALARGHGIVVQLATIRVQELQTELSPRTTSLRCLPTEATQGCQREEQNDHRGTDNRQPELRILLTNDDPWEPRDDNGEGKNADHIFRGVETRGKESPS